MEVFMIERGVKEIRDHFTKYLKIVAQGEEVIVAERGKAVALLKQFVKPSDIEGRLNLASLKGLIRLPKEKGFISVHKKIKVSGKPLSEIIMEGREEKW